MRDLAEIRDTPSAFSEPARDERRLAVGGVGVHQVAVQGELAKARGSTSPGSIDEPRDHRREPHLGRCSKFGQVKLGSVTCV